MWMPLCVYAGHYWVAMISRLLENIGLFCRIQSLLWSPFAKETYDLKEPTNRSNPICMSMHCNTLQRTAYLHHTSMAPIKSGQQHTVTHCTTLQHTATHFGNTLQDSATHCNTLQHIETHCKTLQDTARHCNTYMPTPYISGTKKERAATHCNTLQHTATQ